MVNYRHELKFQISSLSAQLLKKQLSLVMSLDSNSVSQDYSYDIRSLYFDSIDSSAFYEKIDGVQFRSKYRIRIYNYQEDVIKLECKHKDNDMTYKQACSIDKTMALALIDGQYSRIVSNKELINQFIANSRANRLVPSVIVDYRRTAFTYPLSEVRITFDENIRSGRYGLDLFDKDIITFPVYNEDVVVLEVKYNEFMPEHIMDILTSENKIKMAISKFALCRNMK